MKALPIILFIAGILMMVATVAMSFSISNKEWIFTNGQGEKLLAITFFAAAAAAQLIWGERRPG